MKILYQVLIFILVLLLFFFGSLYSNKELTAVFENKMPAHLKIADTPKEMEKGLMGVKRLGPNKGMIFIYPDEKVRSFWMKDTFVELDIIFLDIEKEIVDIQTMVPCKVENCPIYSSKAPAMYAIEVNAGFSQKNNLEIGQRVWFELDN